MKLRELLREVCEVSNDLADIEISDISSDTRAACDSGTLFVCIQGSKFDGHSAAKKMLEVGAAAVIVQKDLGLEGQIIVSDTREALSCIWAEWFGHPERKLKLVGVTGTNGKTTITTVIKQLLEGLGKKTGLIGTCCNQIGSEIIHTERSTPEPNEFFELLAKMAEANCEYVVMEASSQGLEQKRIGKPMFAAAAFTNLTQDHLDVHGSMENYFEAKKLLFSMCESAVVNLDDSYAQRLLADIRCDTVTFSVEEHEKADLFADKLDMRANGSDFELHYENKITNVFFPIAGHYNVSNCLAVIGVMKVLGFDIELISKMIKDCKGVRGRCENIPTGRDFTVICDYAHTPDAIENIISSVRKYARGRVICLFGCGGNRDKTKRPLMAAAAAKFSDFVIVTSDNPRNEEPVDIINDIMVGMPEGTDYVKITDRREAIHWAIQNAVKDDVIVLVGKGHEDYQILKGMVKIHFDEREVVAEALAQL